MYYNVARALNKIGIIKKINTAVTIRINGMKIRVPVINGLGYDNLHISELWMCSLLKKIIPLRQGAFIDIGVNVGQTLIKLRTVDRDKDYIGFEPNPKCVYYTDALIKENKFENCRLIPAGLLDKNEILQLDLYAEDDTDSSASLIKNFRPGQKIYHTIYVPVYKFEQVEKLLGLQKIGIVKIDVEGAELEVLLSLEQTLTVHRPLILIEILPCYSDANTDRITRQQKLEDLLNRIAYRIIRLIKDKDDKSIKEFRLLETIGVHGNMEWCEYMLVPKEMEIF